MHFSSFVIELPASPELRLVMCMLTAPESRFVWGEPANLCAQLSWSRFLEVADDRVSPFLHWVCQQETFNSVIPPHVEQALAKTRFSTRIRNLRWSAELRQIAEKFRRERVSLMMVKGAVLQRTVYPDLSTRPMNDVDLLVRRSEMPQVGRIMASLGFLKRNTPENHTPAPGLSPDEEDFFFKKLGDSILFVEVHTRTEVQSPSLAAAPDFIWSYQGEAVGSDDLLVPTLEPLMALRHLCLHLAKHDFDFGLMWLLDIRLFLEHHGDSIDWDEFIDGCERQALTQIAFTLILAADWLGANVPRRKLESLLPQNNGLAVRLAWKQMTDHVATRKPPNAVILVLAGNPVRVWQYLQTHWCQWTMPATGSSADPWALFGKRFWSDIRTFRAAFSAGGFKFSNVRAAARSDRRAVQLRAMLKPRLEE